MVHIHMLVCLTHALHIICAYTHTVAVQEGHVQLMQVLVGHGADIHKVDEDGENVLFHASRYAYRYCATAHEGRIATPLLWLKTCSVVSLLPRAFESGTIGMCTYARVVINGSLKLA